MSTSENVPMWVGGSATATCAVVFAVGGGGDPARHLPLLEALAAAGCAVAAPSCARLASPRPTDAELLERARRLQLAAAQVAAPGRPLTLIGHSIGGTLSLALAGGQLWTSPQGPLPIEPIASIDRVAMLASPTGFFAGPQTLDAVTAQVSYWRGGADALVPAAQAEILSTRLAPTRFALHVADLADHFAFMHQPPPHMPVSMHDHARFLDQLVRDLVRFATVPPGL